MRASGLSLLISASTAVSVDVGSRSILLRSTTSANAICSRASSCSSCIGRCRASATVTIASSANRPRSTSSSTNDWMTGAGSASPLVSITTRSKEWPDASRSPSAVMRSPRTLQQMQPLLISITVSAVGSVSCPSMPASPNSLTITAMRPAPGVARMWLSSVVFPAPRNPVRTVVGIVCMMTSKAHGTAGRCQADCVAALRRTGLCVVRSGGEQGRMLSREDHRPAVHVRIAAFEAGDFNTVTLLVSDKQDYSFGQRLPKRATTDRIAQALGSWMRFAACASGHAKLSATDQDR